jgi:putative peptidoglycan lipid II flippase
MVSQQKPDPQAVGPSGESPKQTGGLLRSTAVVSVMTLLSRVLGLVRDIVFARFFGAGLLMDAFFVAFKIPNMFRRFFAEGAFSQSFVPVFAEYDERRQHDDDRCRDGEFL